MYYERYSYHFVSSPARGDQNSSGGALRAFRSRSEDMIQTVQWKSTLYFKNNLFEEKRGEIRKFNFTYL